MTIVPLVLQLQTSTEQLRVCVNLHRLVAVRQKPCISVFPLFNILFIFLSGATAPLDSFVRPCVRLTPPPCPRIG